MTREFASLQIPIDNNLFFQFVRWLRDDTGSCSVLCFVDNNNRFPGFNGSLRDFGSSAVSLQQSPRGVKRA